MTIRDATVADTPLIQNLAEKIWWPTYGPLLEEGQIRYMLERIYSLESLGRAMADGSQHFILMYDENEPVGFAAYGPRPEENGVYKLHKLYVLPARHGKGYGKRLIQEVSDRLSQKQIGMLDLNVFKLNPALKFYEHLGFKIIREEDIPFGPYVLRDFVMRLNLPARTPGDRSE